MVATATTPSTLEPTSTHTQTPEATPTTCSLSFEDVPAGSTFQPYITYLACRNIISGYLCGGAGEPCGPNSLPYFRPNANITRAQIAKIVSNAAGFNEPVGAQQFADLLPGSTFYDFAWRLASRNIIQGYPCGNPGEPCGSGNLPYFRPAGAVSRGQLTKMAVLAFGFNEQISGQTFEDVPVGSTFYLYIERMSTRYIINGYPCGSPNEPCGPGNLPYFRPNNPVTRGQTAKIINLSSLQATPTAITR
ncbi:MAG: S-layer homology domain-containing protein [Chloroflexia bacterium]